VARNGSGTYSVVNSFTTGTTISSSSMNANFTDVATALTGSLPRDGQAGMTGQFKAASGTVALPGIAFESDTNTGLYAKAADTIGVVVNGAEIGTFSATGFNDAIGGVPTGAMMMYGSFTAPSGWVRLNGLTIGNAASSATERANADTSTLFSFLWTNYADAVCAVSSGRGASAAADYAANKTITLPDLRGRAFFGLDGMGNVAASRLGSVVTSSNTMGGTGGAETVTLTEANLAAHTHAAGTLATASDGAHTHTYSEAQYTNAAVNNSTSVATSNASGTTSSNGAHTHTITGSTGSAGSGTAHSNMPPAFLTSFIIKL
jgi:microcystin-dependent protein